jgi:transcriptional regulator NrdR family protein
LNDLAAKGGSAGIRCPHCGCCHFYTTNTEPLRGGRIRRRKRCRHWGRRIVTYEAAFQVKKATDR